MEDNKTPKLGSEPIFPCNLRKIEDNEFRIASEKDMREEIYLSSTMGMSKRLYIATQAMTGIMASLSLSGEPNYKFIVNMSFKMADEILKQENL